MTAAAEAPSRGHAPRRGFADVIARARHGLDRVRIWSVRVGLRAAAIAGPALSVARMWVAPRLAVVSPIGWVAILLTVGALVAGFSLGWQELTYLGFTVLVAMACCVLFLAGRSTYEVSVVLSPPRVVVGDKALGRLAIRNSGAKGVLPSRMELPVGAGLAEFAVPGLKPQEDHEELFAVPTHRRAVIVAGPAVSVRGDQLGLLRRTVRWTEPVDLFVHPRTTPLAPSAAGLVRDLEGQVTNKITDSDLSFHALRDYAPGDDRRYVHWRTSARRIQQSGDPSDIMVRQFEETRRSQLTIVISEYTGYYASDEEFELAISVAASIGAQVVRDGTQVNVVSETRRLHTHSPTVLLDDSCRLDRVGRRHPDARSFVRDVTRRLPDPSVLMVVAGSGMTTTDYRMIQMLFPSDTTMIAFRVDAGAAPALRPVSTLRVATIGTLSDLPKVLRRTGL
jgi:uncharacterized protein (DUF58 family)